MEPVDKHYLLSALDNSDLLLTRLNHLMTNNFSDDLIQVLLQLNCNHSNCYVRYSSAQVIIRCVTTGRLSLHDICNCKQWHCLGQMSLFLCRLLTKKPIDQCSGFEVIVKEVLSKICVLNQTTEQLCEEHCLCSTCDILVDVISHSDDSDINQIIVNLLSLSRIVQKRCYIRKLINLLVFTVKQNDKISLSIKTICDFVFDKKSLFARTNLSDVLHAFGGQYLSDKDVELDNDYKCDVVVLRQTSLLMLLTLSHQSGLVCNQQQRERLNLISQFVMKTCEQFDDSDWPIKLFIEEDEQLLTALHCLIGLSDTETSHLLMDAFIVSIGCDSSVLLDMLCSDEQTATILLKLLLIYLKLTDIMTNVSVNVRNVLNELREKMQRLATKQLFPYNVKPLIRLLNKLN